MNNKAGAESVFLIAVIPIIVVVFFGVWIYANGIINTTLLNTPDTTVVNVSEAATATFVPVNAGFQYLRLIGFTIFFGLVLSFFIINAFVKSHPFLLVVYVFVSMFGTILSVYISNAYEQQLLTLPMLGATFQSFSVLNFVLSNLPLLVGTIGLLGAIILFINLPRDGGLAEFI